MKLKLIKEWIAHHRGAIASGGVTAIIVIGTSLFVVGNSISKNVADRTPLFDVPILELKLDAVPAKLSGLLVDKLDANRLVTGIMVENSPEARPQSGLDSAEVVFEAIAEGGITRFAVFYQVERPAKIGPVRSVRPAFVDWVSSFDASIAHVGGSNQGLRDIRTYGVKDLDQFANGAYYYRSNDRYAPHNVYTSIAKLNELEVKKGFKKSSFTGWTYADGQKIETPKATSITADISSFLFQVNYEYDKNRNNYQRNLGGEPHIDANTKSQIRVDNVVIIEASYSVDGSGYYNYKLTGSGDAHIFNNGDYIKGRWSRSSKTASFVFKKGSKNVVLNRGQTWVTAIQSGASPKVSAN